MAVGRIGTRMEDNKKWSDAGSILKGLVTKWMFDVKKKNKEFRSQTKVLVQ